MEDRYRVTGEGRPVVLLHAFPLSAEMWSAQHAGLGSRARLVTPHQRGFGGTPLGDARPSLDVVADDVAALLDELGIARAVVGGLSMGGYVAMAFLRRHPDRVAGIVLADTKGGPDPEPAAANRRRIADELERTGSSEVLVEKVYPPLLAETTRTEHPDLADRVRADIASAAPAAAAWAQRAMAERPDSFDTLRAVTVPALVVVGEEDALAPVVEAQAMVDALPDAELVTVRRAGHLSAVEAPAAFNAAVIGFLDRL